MLSYCSPVFIKPCQATGLLLANPVEQHVIAPLILRHIDIPDAGGVLLPGGKNAPDVQIADIDGLVSLVLVVGILAAIENAQVYVRIHGEEERHRVPLQASLVANSVYSRREQTIGLLLEVLAHVAHQHAGLRRRIDPHAILVENLKGGDRVLEDEGQPV